MIDGLSCTLHGRLSLWNAGSTPVQNKQCREYKQKRQILWLCRIYSQRPEKEINVFHYGFTSFLRIFHSHFPSFPPSPSKLCHSLIRCALLFCWADIQLDCINKTLARLLSAGRFLSFYPPRLACNPDFLLGHTAAQLFSHDIHREWHSHALWLMYIYKYPGVDFD